MPALRRLARWGSMLLCLAVLPLALVFTSGTAHALVAAPPKPPSIGGVIRTVPVGTAVKAGGKLTPFVRVPMALLSLYQVADTVFDLPGGAAPTEGNDPTEDRTGATIGCAISQAVSITDGGQFAGGSFAISGCAYGAGSSTMNFTTVVRNITCRNDAVNASPKYLTNGTQQGPSGNIPGQPGIGTYPIPAFRVCPPGTRFISGDAETQWIQATGRSPRTYLGEPYPAEDYTQTTSVQCRKADGSIVTITETLEGHPGKIVIPSCFERVPGSQPWKVDATGSPQNGAPQSLLDITPDRNLLTKYPDCFAGGAVSCVVRVFVNGQPCVFGMPGCVNWKEDLEDGTGTADCRFGSYVIPLATCAPLRKSYRKKNAGTLTGNGPASDPEVVHPDSPDDYPEPRPTPGTGTNPNPNPSPQPNPSGAPNPTAGPNPTSPKTDPDEGTDPDSQDCFGDAWGWNPVDWVVVPVKCALIWAFKPKTPFTDRMNGWKAQFGSRAPFSWVAGLSAIPTAIPGSGCPNWVVEVAGRRENVVCGKPYTEAIRGARPVIFAFMLTLALWPLIRGVAYASIPVVKPVPGKL